MQKHRIRYEHFVGQLATSRRKGRLAEFEPPVNPNELKIFKHFHEIPRKGSEKGHIFFKTGFFSFQSFGGEGNTGSSKKNTRNRNEIERIR